MDLLFLLFCSSFCFLTIQAQQPSPSPSPSPSQSSSSAQLLSLACGTPQSFTFTDRNGLPWRSDSSYINAGEAATVKLPASNSTAIQDSRLTTLRYFPDNSAPKFCYTFAPLTPNRSYLLRASFLYGNYDGESRLPSFDLLVNADRWAHVQIADEQTPVAHDFLFQSLSSAVSVCLARSGPHHPFISTLQIGIPIDGAYSAALLTGFALSSLSRIDWGASSSSQPIRYPYDKLDRIWYPNTKTPKLQTKDVIVEKLAEQPPSEVLQTAATTLHPHDNLTIVFPGLGSVSSIFLALYFTETNKTVREGGRVFDVYLNVYKGGASPWFPAMDVYKFSQAQNMGAVEIYSPGSISLSSDSLVLTLKPSANSTLGPLLSASEIFEFSKEQLHNGTNQDEIQSLAKIQRQYNLTGWQGDPCLPVNYSWNWVSCAPNGNGQNIIALKLSNASLHGNISSDISSLTQLQEIFLDHNNLTGEIPDLSALKDLQTLDLSNNRLAGTIPSWLSSLPRLSKLYLQNNSLSGEIPKGLLQSKSDGTLDFEYEGNPKLICPSSNQACPSSNISPSSPPAESSQSTPQVPSPPPPPPPSSATNMTIKGLLFLQLLIMFLLILC